MVRNGFRNHPQYGSFPPTKTNGRARYEEKSGKFERTKEWVLDTDGARGSVTVSGFAGFAGDGSQPL